MEEETQYYMMSDLILTTFIILMVILIFVWQPYYCKQWGDKYTQNSQCFNINYRCNIECKQYGLNYTNKTEGCNCDCGVVYVSICTGTIYNKTNIIKVEKLTN